MKYLLITVKYGNKYKEASIVPENGELQKWLKTVMPILLKGVGL